MRQTHTLSLQKNNPSMLHQIQSSAFFHSAWLPGRVARNAQTNTYLALSINNKVSSKSNFTGATTLQHIGTEMALFNAIICENQNQNSLHTLCLDWESTKSHLEKTVPNDNCCPQWLVP